MAVTQDAKDSKTADFTVNMKEPVALQGCSRMPGFESSCSPPRSWTPPTTPTPPFPPQRQAAKAQIVLKDGFIQEEKKAAPVHRRPAPGHHRGE